MEPRASAEAQAEAEKDIVSGATNKIAVPGKNGGGSGDTVIIYLYVVNIGRAAGRGRATLINGPKNSNRCRSVVRITDISVRLWSPTFV